MTKSMACTRAELFNFSITQNWKTSEITMFEKAKRSPMVCVCGTNRRVHKDSHCSLIRDQAAAWMTRRTNHRQAKIKSKACSIINI